MLGKSLISGKNNSPSQDRVFVYEVAGLKQSDENDNNSYPLRTSDNVFVKVPYSRMNQEMRRITMMGGKIVNISPLELSKKNKADSVEDSAEEE